MRYVKEEESDRKIISLIRSGNDRYLKSLLLCNCFANYLYITCTDHKDSHRAL